MGQALSVNIPVTYPKHHPISIFLRSPKNATLE